MEAIKIVLASASPRRIELMKNLGLQFEVLPSDLDEVVDQKLSPAQVVAQLAEIKASRVCDLLCERETAASYVVIAADTIVVFEGTILGKPADRADGIAMLTRLSGHYHEVFTGVHVIALNTAGSGKASREAHHEVEVSKVQFRPLSPIEISTYIDSGEPMDKAGSYALQGIGAFMINNIEGSPSNIIGLPLVRTTRLLRQCGVTIMGE
jgi:septum formation protein